MRTPEEMQLAILEVRGDVDRDAPWLSEVQRQSAAEFGAAVWCSKLDAEDASHIGIMYITFAFRKPPIK